LVGFDRVDFAAFILKKDTGLRLGVLGFEVKMPIGLTINLEWGFSEKLRYLAGRQAHGSGQRLPLLSNKDIGISKLQVGNPQGSGGPV
jgi:hypothetical protein